MNRPDGEVVTLRTANPPCGGSIPPQASINISTSFSVYGIFIKLERKQTALLSLGIESRNMF